VTFSFFRRHMLSAWIALPAAPVLLVYKIGRGRLLRKWVLDRCIRAGYFNSALLKAAAFSAFSLTA